MTVKQLIEKLKTMHQDVPVVFTENVQIGDMTWDNQDIEIENAYDFETRVVIDR